MLNAIKDLLYATMGANTEKAQGDFSGEQYEEKAREPVPQNSGGAPSWNDLTDKPFGETVIKTTVSAEGVGDLNAYFCVEKNGVVEKVTIDDAKVVEGFYLVDAPISYGTARNTVFLDASGAVYLAIADIWDSRVSRGDVNDNYVRAEILVVTYKDNVNFDGMTFPTAGTYVHVYLLHDHRCKMVYSTAAAKPLAPKYLPNLVITAKWDYDTKSLAYTANMSFENAKAAISEGVNVFYYILEDGIPNRYTANWVRVLDSRIIANFIGFENEQFKIDLNCDDTVNSGIT